MKRLMLMMIAALALGKTAAGAMDFPLLQKFTMSLLSSHAFYQKDDDFYTDGLVGDGNHLVRIDFQNNEVDKVKKVAMFGGVVGSKLHIITPYLDDGGGEYLYDLHSRDLEPWDDSWLKYNWVFADYQNGIFFSSIDLHINQFIPQKYDLNTKRVEKLEGLTGAAICTSPDKMHLLIDASHTEGKIYIWNTTEERPVGPGIPNGIHFGRLVFLTNRLFLVSPNRETQPLWGIYSVEGELVESLGMHVNQLPRDPLLFWFNADLTRALVSYKEGEVFHSAIVDTSELRNYLKKVGLLFKPTGGVVNDNRVRVRENPNLQAKHLGFLNKGDRVDALGRSGIKVRIGQMYDYWYKVRTPEGLEGWSYGYFIDLQE